MCGPETCLTVNFSIMIKILWKFDLFLIQTEVILLL